MSWFAFECTQRREGSSRAVAQNWSRSSIRHTKSAKTSAACDEQFRCCSAALRRERATSVQSARGQSGLSDQRKQSEVNDGEVFSRQRGNFSNSRQSSSFILG